MIGQHYGDLSIDDALHQSLEALLNRYTLPENAERLVLNCRQMVSNGMDTPSPQ